MSMPVIKCKMCGGDIELSPDKTFETCEFCGSTMTFSKVDDEQRAAAFNRGNHFRRIGEFDDVFICYKESDENGARTRDFALAQDIYYQLTEQGRRVFFAWSWYAGELSVLQSYDMAKLGFIQDLIRGISKVLDADREPAQTVVVQESTNVGSIGNAGALLDRGMMALEDGDLEKADGLFEEVLSQDAKCAEAYVGKALAETRCRSLEAFVQPRLLRTMMVRPDMALLKAE